MTFLFAAIILYYCYSKPVVGLALLLQINIIRSLAIIDIQSPCFVCINEPDLLLGAITPLVGFSLIIIKLSFRKRIKYAIDDFDGFFLLSIPVLFIASFYSPNLTMSLDYSLRFLFLGSGFYFITKISISNTNQYLKNVYLFCKATLILSIFLGTIAGVLYLTKGENHLRLTLPGVHPIPFSQLIGAGVLVSFVTFITNGRFLQIQSKTLLNINKPVLLYLTILLLATNTRGVMLAVGAAILFYVIVTKVKIKKRTLYISGGILLIGLIAVINYIDVDVLFTRMFSPHTAKSIDDRLIAYQDSFMMLFHHPFGVGTNGFSYYSILPYPHNLFLESLANYGIFGIVMSIYFLLLMLYMLLITIHNRKKDYIYVFLYALFIYFFIETMFSFTLWMHKGLYLSIGLFAAYHYKFKRDNILLKNKHD